MSLYDDVNLVSESSKKLTEWILKMVPIQTHLKMKNLSNSRSEHKLVRRSTRGGDLTEQHSVRESVREGLYGLYSSSPWFTDPNEYDPMKPNIYKEIKNAENSRCSYSKPNDFQGSSSTTTNIPGEKVAAQIMEKYGYQQGLGLGKTQQGIPKALNLQKISQDRGIILAMPMMVLTNINALDVDDELEEEIRGECEKYGTVNQVEVVEENERIKVFVEFTNDEDALSAVDALNGRYFGGRAISARIENRF